MTGTLRPLGLAVALLAAAPAFAADPELTEKDKIDRVLRELQAVRQEVTDLRASVAAMGQNTQRDVRELARRVEELEHLAERPGSTRTRISSSFTPSEPAAATATIRLQNRYSVPATVYVNGQAYSVPPYETRRVANLPSGPFTYEVQAEGYGVIQPAVSRAVNPGETFSIFINPPAAPQLMLVPGI